MRIGVSTYLLAFGMAILSCLLFPGCATNSANTDALQPSDATEPPDILFRSIEAVYAQREIPVAVTSSERRIVVGEWENMTDQLRRRYVSRVITAGKNVALHVHAEYQRRDLRQGQDAWTPADDPYTKERAGREENSLGEEIRNDFRRRR